MEPVLAVHALNHKVELYGLVVLVARQVAMTINVEKGLVVFVVYVFVVFLFLELAAKRLM